MPTVSEGLETTAQDHQTGNLQQAEAQYRKILQAEPGQPEALHALGIIAFQSRNYNTAMGFIKEAIHNNPQVPQFHYNAGLVLVAKKNETKPSGLSNRQ